MEKETSQIKFLIGVASILAALIVGYHAFYIPSAMDFSDISDFSEELASMASQTEYSGITENGKVKLNTAGLEELDLLPGIGPSLAQAILDYREDHGAFSSLTDLMNVPGIGEKTFAEIQNMLTLE